MVLSLFGYIYLGYLLSQYFFSLCGTVEVLPVLVNIFEAACHMNPSVSKGEAFLLEILAKIFISLPDGQLQYLT
jgi:hypothetical protein